MDKINTCTEDSEHDLFAWLDDIDAGYVPGNTQQIDEIVTVIEEQLPNFILGWTVKELCSALRRR